MTATQQTRLFGKETKLTKDRSTTSFAINPFALYPYLAFFLALLFLSGIKAL